jgi:hypothetical protein
MSGAFCRDPVAAEKLGLVMKTPDDYPCAFNPFGSAYYDWGQAFPSTGATIGTILLYLAGAAFVGVVIGTDASAVDVLGYMLVFTGLQFIPYIAYLLVVNGPNPIKGLFLNLVYRPDLPPVGMEAAWAKRSTAAQRENTTALTIFAPAVLLFLFRHPGDMDDIQGACWAFLIARVVHYVTLVGPIGSSVALPVFPTVSFLASIGISCYIVIKALIDTATPATALIGGINLQ